MGTERHEARRIDNQLRGRSGRQGDPGESRFYLALEDDLMRIFGSDRISGLMDKLGMDDDMPIENKLVSRAVEGAQKKVEAHNFDIRKHLIEYDDVMNKQRTEIYSFRKEILASPNLKERILEMSDNTVQDFMELYCPEGKHHEDWDLNALRDALYGTFDIQIEKFPEDRGLSDFIMDEVRRYYDEREQRFGEPLMRYLERMVLLQIVDSQWKDHLLAMDHLKEGVGLRGYAQRDPLAEYKKEAFDIFAELTGRITAEALTRLFKIQVREEREISRTAASQNLIYNRGDEPATPTVHKSKKVGRNDPCTCGSGKKYKKCCGKNA